MNYILSRRFIHTYSSHVLYNKDSVKEWYQRRDHNTKKIYYEELFSKERRDTEPHEGYIPLNKQTESPFIRFLRSDRLHMHTQLPGIRYWITFGCVLFVLFLWDTYQNSYNKPSIVSSDTQLEEIERRACADIHSNR